jgi:hypothetical protein
MHITPCTLDQFLTNSRKALRGVACSDMRAGYPQLRPQSLGASAKSPKPLCTRLSASFIKFFA